jgi:hypothetical protein
MDGAESLNEGFPTYVVNTRPSEAVGCILMAGREGNMGILGKIRPSEFPFFTRG